MSTVKCPACGQDSDMPDFCSHCGAAIADTTVADPAAAATATAPAAPTLQPTGAAGGEHCPVCKSHRDDPSSQFCGVCGYDFVTKQGGDVSVLAPATPAATAATPVVDPSPAPQPVPPTALSGPRLDLTVEVNGASPRTFSLFDEESLIGRTSTSGHPTVPTEDKGASRRHALIVRRADGTYTVRDLNSNNGTALNGKALVAGEDTPLNQGDKVTLGEYTIITVVSIRLS